MTGIDTRARLMEARRQARSDARRGLTCDPCGFTGESVEAYRAAFRAYFFREYRGVTIERRNGPGFTGARLPWSALGYGAADTLDGMRRLIRESRV